METPLWDRESETPEDVYVALHNAGLSCSFRVFGSQLGLDPQDLNEIESAHFSERLIKLLVKCSERRSLTWTWIVDVLRKPALREFNVAMEIEEHHCERSSRASGSRSLSLSSSTSSCGPLSPMSPTFMEMGMLDVTFTCLCVCYVCMIVYTYVAIVNVCKSHR